MTHDGIPLFVRFSTVAGERGSKDTARDVRGFAVKFYTNEGNWDLVGNNIPVFFIQDAMKFPDLVHAVKPERHHGMPDGKKAVQVLACDSHIAVFINEAFTHGKSILVIGAGKKLLKPAGIGAKKGDDPGIILTDGADAAGATITFVNAIAGHRHASRE